MQRDLGMKVTTDACIFGALLADIDLASGDKILDIGTGTGLLTLMAAQLHPESNFTAVEIDSLAYHQACENCLNSPWNTQISIIHQSIQEFHQATTEGYDLIIANPPFYTAHQQSKNSRKAVAHHSTSLGLSDLASAVSKLLKPEGQFVVLLPAFESEQLRDILGSKSIAAKQVVNVHNVEGDDRIFRKISTYHRGVEGHVQSRFDIRTRDGVYSPEFIKYLSQFYLQL